MKTNNDPTPEILNSIQLAILAAGLRAHWQMGSMDDWFCSSCGRSHGCDTSVEVMACDPEGLPIPGVRSRVICGDCFDDRKAEIAALLTEGVHAFVLDGRLIDWGCPGMSPAAAFQPLSSLVPNDGPLRCPATVDMFTGEVGV